MKLTPETLQFIRKSKKIKTQLMLQWDISNSTIQNWLNSNNPLLCHPDSLAIISKESQILIPELVTDWSDTLQEALIP